MKKRWRGSYTVEAAFIMPILLGILFTILYVSMIFHDKTLLQAEWNRLVILSANGDVDIKTYDYKKTISKNLWIMEVESADIEKGVVWYRGKVTARATVSVPVLSYFINGAQKAVIEETYGILRPELGKRREEIGKD